MRRVSNSAISAWIDADRSIFMGLHESRARAWTLLGSFEPAHQDYERAIELAEQRGDRVSHARLLSALGALWGGHRDYQRAAELTARAASVAEETGDPLSLAEARFQESLASYQKTVQGAFREVSDGLIAYQRTREFRQRQEERTQAHRDATELANVRYEGGVTSYLEVLYNEQELFSAELGLAQARRDEFLSVIQLYRALGGGWTEPVGAQVTSTSVPR